MEVLSFLFLKNCKRKQILSEEQDEIEFYSTHKRRMVDLDEAAVTTDIRRFI